MNKKKNTILIVVGVLLLAIGVSFGYFVAEANFTGDGSFITGSTGEGIKVEYDAGTSMLSTTSLYPGKSISKSFSVTVNPSNVSNTVTYLVKLNIDTNTFTYCTNDNYDSITNACKIGEEELIYTLKDSDGNVISTDTLMEVTDTIELALETKTVNTKTKYDYTLEVSFIETNADQNHNKNKTITGNIKVEFSEPDNSDLNIVAINVEDENIEGKYNKSDKVPLYSVLNEELSYCEADGVKDENINIIHYYYKSSINVENISSKGTKCYLYFDNARASKVILSDKNISTRTDFTVTYTADTTGTLFAAEDDDGTSYYYAGAPTDNYVKFAGKYWRIIRINGDGSIRIIYAGDATTIDVLDNRLEVLANGYDDSTTKYTQTETSAFNDSRDNNMYVGFMYTSGQVHGLGTTSTIKETLDTWYGNNLITFADYIDTNAGFCGDRTPYTDNSGTISGGGTGTTTTYYGTYIRLNKSNSVSNVAPSLKCNDKVNDLYTIGTSKQGNKALTNPIGLISADEASYAGALLNSANKAYYLYTRNTYWTISPSYLNNSYANVLVVYSSGEFQAGHAVTNTNGVRPVINLKADTIFKEGTTGTADNPYVVI